VDIYQNDILDVRYYCPHDRQGPTVESTANKRQEPRISQKKKKKKEYVVVLGKVRQKTNKRLILAKCLSVLFLFIKVLFPFYVFENQVQYTGGGQVPAFAWP
jgi:hypothetical protein